MNQTRYVIKDERLEQQALVTERLLEEFNEMADDTVLYLDYLLEESKTRK